MRAMAFPDRESLCERCGYSLQGLSAEGSCPECGQAVAASSPVHRDGPSWERRASVGSWLATSWGVLLRPGRTFRAMRTQGSNVASRLYLLSIAVLVGLGWGALSHWSLGRPGVVAWGQGCWRSTRCGC